MISLYPTYYLKEPGCAESVNGSAEWLEKNLGIFSNLASLKELKEINNNFSAVSSNLFYKSHICIRVILYNNVCISVLGNNDVQATQ